MPSQNHPEKAMVKGKAISQGMEEIEDHQDSSMKAEIMVGSIKARAGISEKVDFSKSSNLATTTTKMVMRREDPKEIFEEEIEKEAREVATMEEE